MKVINSLHPLSNETSFGELLPGVVFRCRSYTYIKLAQEHKFVEGEGFVYWANAICLDGNPGGTTQFSPDDRVIAKPNAAVYLEG